MDRLMGNIIQKQNIAVVVMTTNEKLSASETVTIFQSSFKSFKIVRQSVVNGSICK